MSAAPLTVHVYSRRAASQSFIGHTSATCGNQQLDLAEKGLADCQADHTQLRLSGTCSLELCLAQARMQPEQTKPKQPGHAWRGLQGAVT